jgi:hypothetical protein
LCNSSCGKQCKKCRFINCYRTCNEYSTKKCCKINRYPYVCNACSTVTTCTNEKDYYRAKVTDTKYKELFVSSREGLYITSKELKKIDEINCCERTLYYYFDKNAFKARSIDLPRKVKYKPRKKSTLPTIKDYTYRIGRTFDDFVKFIEDNTNLPNVIR